jgi:hypothetical protein
LRVGGGVGCQRAHRGLVVRPSQNELRRLDDRSAWIKTPTGLLLSILQLSFPKIISARSDDAVLTELA